MPIGQDKEVQHKTCPFKSSAATAHQEVGRSTSPREMCSHACALYDEKEGACVFRIIAKRLLQPASGMLEEAVTGAMGDLSLSK